MLVSAVVLNWNDYRCTLACISSLKQILTPPGVSLEIIVVDNGSTDNSLSHLEKKTGTVLIKNPRNLGFTGGNNAGIQYAIHNDSDYVWIINPDVTVDRYCLKELLSFATTKPKGAVFSPKIYFFPGFEYHADRYFKSDLGKVLWYAGGKINWATVMGQHLGVNEVDGGQFATPRQIEFATGANLLVRRELFQKTGGFDERFFLYLEDADFSLKTKKYHHEIWFVPRAVSWHKNAQSSSVGGALHDYYFARNRLLFGLTHAPTRLKIALIRESIRLLISGRIWQKRGVRDFYLSRFGQGSFQPTKNSSG